MFGVAKDAGVGLRVRKGTRTLGGGRVIGVYPSGKGLPS